MLGNSNLFCWLFVYRHTFYLISNQHQLLTWPDNQHKIPTKSSNITSWNQSSGPISITIYLFICACLLLLQSFRQNNWEKRGNIFSGWFYFFFCTSFVHACFSSLSDKIPCKFMNCPLSISILKLPWCCCDWALAIPFALGSRAWHLWTEWVV